VGRWLVEVEVEVKCNLDLKGSVLQIDYRIYECGAVGLGRAGQIIASVQRTRVHPGSGH
jgi:hypothetical protein